MITPGIPGRLTPVTFKRSALQVNLIPGRRKREFQMRIVRENRLAGAGARPGQHPGIGARHRLASGTSRKQRRDFGSIAGLCQLITKQIVVPGGGQRAMHVHGNRHGVGYRPGPWLVLQQPELQRQLVPVLVDKFIHASRVGRQVSFICRAQGSNVLFRGAANAKAAQFPIAFDRGSAHDFRKFSGRRAPDRVHLPQSVLCGHVPLREQSILNRRCPDVRNSQRIPGCRYFCGDAGRNSAGGLRHWPPRIPIQRCQRRNQGKPNDGVNIA
jgi:hypothetical protein